VSAAVNIHAQTMANKLLLLEVGSDRAPVNILNVHQAFAPGVTAAGTRIRDRDL
jgi:hypothetical protein